MPYPPKPDNPTEISQEHTLKGCIHYFDFKSDEKARTIDDVHPCLIISRNNRKSKRVIISPISDAENYTFEDGTLKYGFHALLKKEDYDFLEKDSVVLLDQVITIPKEVLFEEWYIGKLTNMRLIDEAIAQNYDLIDTIRQLLDEMIDEAIKRRVSNQ